MSLNFGNGKRRISFKLSLIFPRTVIFACLLLAYFKRTRTPLTSFIHSFWFPMMLFSSAMLKPVSFRSWSTYVVAGLPLFLVLCFGSQSSGSLITSSFFLQQSPINCGLLIISVSIILEGCCTVLCWFFGFFCLLFLPVPISHPTFPTVGKLCPIPS